MKKILFSVPFVILFCAGTLYLCQKAEQKSAASVTSNNIINASNFLCADNKNILAIFFRDRVELTLSDGRNMLLSQAISASGARYANSDESFVFWNKGDTAFVNENNTTTFKNCITRETAQTQSTQLANPASENCLGLGGNLKIETNDDGSQYGMCYLKDNRVCEEWALFRGECTQKQRD